MAALVFLQAEAVHFLHDQTVREFGGLHGLRDAGLLLSALDRTANRLHYADAAEAAGVFDLAACYAFGIVRNHPFNDGNKRTAWASCVLFLRLNGVRVRVPPIESVGRVVRLAAGSLGKAGFAAWLRG